MTVHATIKVNMFTLSLFILASLAVAVYGMASQTWGLFIIAVVAFGVCRFYFKVLDQR